MKIVLSGIETNNKGAELMLYAILQEIEHKYPDAEVYVPIFAIKQGLGYVKTNLRLKEKSFAKYIRFASHLHIIGILRRLRLPYSLFDDSKPLNGINYFIDASGFAFSDQWESNKRTIKYWNNILSGYHRLGTKIVFLPQAFGPAEKTNTKKLINLLNCYANLIMPREAVSLKYLQYCNVDKRKLHKFTDFTSLVEGIFPTKYEYLKNGICIIPNLRMIDKGVVSLDDYLYILTEIIDLLQSKCHPTYILNHEGLGDEGLAYMCKKRLNEKVVVVTGLNALEVKGLIASSYLCISSRFHGVASALSSSVPCLATSWSHKYAELFKDYGMGNCILDLRDIKSCISMINDFLDEGNNQDVRGKLRGKLPQIKIETKKMWNLVWAYN